MKETHLFDIHNHATALLGTENFVKNKGGHIKIPSDNLDLVY